MPFNSNFFSQEQLREVVIFKSGFCQDFAKEEFEMGIIFKMSFGERYFCDIGLFGDLMMP